MARSETSSARAMEEASRIAADLLRWYSVHRRDLPWRKTRDPYAIWVSEVMLQQTQVETVRPYYARWLARFPDIRSLAESDESEVLTLWQGLGYYSRARRLRAGAQAVVAHFNGALPANVDALLRLPGIGPYSAGAIASIAFNQPVPLVDGNVVRVVTRLFALRGDPTRAPLKSRIWELAEKLIVPGRARDSNQALMELGATLCTPQKPLCLTCPVRGSCTAAARGLTLKLPELPPRRAVTQVSMLAALIRKRGRYFICQVPDKAARWAGMWQFPNLELKPEETQAVALRRLVHQQFPPGFSSTAHALTLRHSVTRFRITLNAYYCEAASGVLQLPSRDPSSRWCFPKGLEGLPMPAAHRRLAQIIASRA